MQDKYKVYLDDILISIEKIEKNTKGVSYKEFSQNSLISDGVIRNLEVIGEAVKKLSVDLKKKYPDVEWKKIAGLRDILIHEYFGIDLNIVWDIIINKIPKLKNSIKEVMKNLYG